MNCEKCQDLIEDFIDGSLGQEDQAKLNLHLEECLGCADVRNDLQAIVSFCREHRGEYSAPPNERALWLRIRNMIEAGESVPASRPARASWGSWISRSWELSFSQLAAAAAAIVLVVSLSTVVGLRRWQSGDAQFKASGPDAGLQVGAANVRDRVSQQQQLISYWNQRVEFNKARWNPEMRETFDRNLKVIDQAVNESFDALTLDPHDEVSEEMLNAALNEKLSLLKEFAAL
ncbi:MAG TPA: zf-HC2 domain-containing protein [Pyrinomonadaceae bacterium]|nr:zf-HC2 domain-containing protein [Pyrinomonadaceae bacterium]